MDAKEFGAFLAQVRRERNMTQDELAQQLHVTDKAVSALRQYPDAGQAAGRCAGPDPR